MKAAILGTTDYHATMREAVQRALLPQPKSAEIPILLPPVAENYASFTDDVMRKITAIGTLENCNPRVPYLFFVWLLMGSDNPYRLYQYLGDSKIYLQVAILLLRIALGDNLPERITELSFQASRANYNDNPTNAHGTVTTIAKIIFYAAKGFDHDVYRFVLSLLNFDLHQLALKQKIGKYAMWQVIRQRGRKWSHITDDEVLQVAHQFLFDILDAGK